MLTLLSEIHFWGTQDDVVLKDVDFGSFKYYSKKDPNDNLCLQSKKSYAQARGLVWHPVNKRPVKLKDKLRELEDSLFQNKVVNCCWDNNKLTLLLSRGILVTTTVNGKTSDVIGISFDKQLCSKLQNEIICDGIISGNQIICSCSDGRVLGHGGQWKDGWTVDGGPRKYLNQHGELLAVWGKSSAEHPQPWSPLAKDHQRANLHLYWVGARGPDLLSYKKTDGEPIAVVVSKIFHKNLIVVEQKVSARGAVSIEVSVLELLSGTLKRATVTAVPLQTQVSCCSLSKNENRLILGCIDGSVALLDRNRGSTRIVKASFIPTLTTWNSSNAVAVISNERGQIQYFDTALNPIKSQLNLEENTANIQLDLSSYFNTQPTLDSINWTYKDLLVMVENGPLILITHCERSLSFLALIDRYLTNGKVDKAINVLLSWDWSEQCYIALQKIVVHLMKKPLTEENAQFIQKALGSFHSPDIPLNVQIKHRYGSQVKALTRRFFHQLVRCSMFETAFLLAVDLGHHDLFMDLHYIAVMIGETEMAAAARAQASALLSRCSSEASNCSRSSCSQCSGTGSSGDCSSEDDSDTQRTSFNTNPYLPSNTTSENYLTTNFNSINPKTMKPSVTYSTYIPPIPNIDLPKINFTKPAIQKPPAAPPNYTHRNNVNIGNLHVPPLPVTPPLPITSSINSLNSVNTQLGIPIVNFPNTYNMGSNRLQNLPSFSYPSVHTNRPSPIYSGSNQAVNNNFPLPEIKTYPTVHSIITPPPLPIAPPLLNHNLNQNSSIITHKPPHFQQQPIHTPLQPSTSASSTTTVKKPQAKVKFSDTVTAFIVPEVKRPVRPPLPAHLMDPQKELADSLPLCHPNEDYLKDFTPVQKTESTEIPPTAPKIKVVHFGVV